MGPGGYWGGVYRVGTRVVIPGTTQPRCSRRTQKHPGEAGPRKPCRGWSGWGAGPDVLLGRWAGTAISPPLRGPVGPPGPSLGYTLEMPTYGQYGEIQGHFS